MTLDYLFEAVALIFYTKSAWWRSVDAGGGVYETAFTVFKIFALIGSILQKFEENMISNRIYKPLL